jgi:hypothetical protein
MTGQGKCHNSGARLLGFADAAAIRPMHILELFQVLGGGRGDAGLDAVPADQPVPRHSRGGALASSSPQISNLQFQLRASIRKSNGGCPNRHPPQGRPQADKKLPSF